jgi:hypothetical protein
MTVLAKSRASVNDVLRHDTDRFGPFDPMNVLTLRAPIDRILL